MSKAESEFFPKNIRSSDSLKTEALTADTDEVVVEAFAKKKGYDVTAVELKEYAYARKPELSSEDLEKTADGMVQVWTNAEAVVELQREAVTLQRAAAETTVVENMMSVIMVTQ